MIAGSNDNRTLKRRIANIINQVQYVLFVMLLPYWYGTMEVIDTICIY